MVAALAPRHRTTWKSPNRAGRIRHRSLPDPGPVPPAGAACVNGFLDPKAYFFLRCRAVGFDIHEDDPADNWEEVLTALVQRDGWRRGPDANTPMPADAPHFGLSLQLGGDGRPKARLFLPTVGFFEADDHEHPGQRIKWYFRTVCINSSDGAIGGTWGVNPRWTWQEPFGSGEPPYVARPCS